MSASNSYSQNNDSASQPHVLDRLASVPLEQIGFDDIRIRRAIERAGFDNLADALRLSTSEIDNIFDARSADCIILMKERLERGGSGYIESLLKNREQQTIALERSRKAAEALTGQPDWGSPVIGTFSSATVVREGNTLYRDYSAPPNLVEIESRCRKALDLVADRYDEPMVYLAFEELEDDLDELKASLSALFTRLRRNPGALLSIVERTLPDAWVVHVAHRARSLYDGGNLWINFFSELSINSYGSISSELKRLFLERVKKRGFPVYGKTEELNRYFYTALLHGGLSEYAWRELWEIILPKVRKGERFQDGYDLLHDLLVEGGKVDVSQKAVLNILKKAPESTLAPLFDASLRVANDIRADQQMSKMGEFSLITGYGLPDIALDALTAYGDERQAKRDGRTSSQTQSLRDAHTSRGNDRLVIPSARLQLNLDDRSVEIHWKRQKFPYSLLGCEIRFFVNGRLARTEHLEPEGTSSVLETTSVPVELASRYVVELKLVRCSSQHEETVIGSREQEFVQNKPGCLEFIYDLSGAYRLRESRDRIHKPRKVAFILKTGYALEPGFGMSPIERFASDGGPSIAIFEVNPGASASLVKTGSAKTVVSSWKEDYTARIHREAIIGETKEGVDVFGVSPNKQGGNDALPFVTLDVADGTNDPAELEYACYAGDIRIPLQSSKRWQSDEAPGNASSCAASIELSLRNTPELTTFAPDCRIVVRRAKSAQKPNLPQEIIFQYRFAVIPIQRFRPTDIKLEHGRFTAVYQFQATEAVAVWQPAAPKQEIGAYGSYAAKRLLKDEFLELAIAPDASNARALEIKLALAAIDIELPEKLLELARDQRPCLANVIDLPRRLRNASLSVRGSRFHRAVYISLGNLPLFYRELHHQSESSFLALGDLTSFKLDDIKAKRLPLRLPVELPLRIRVMYGEEPMPARFERRRPETQRRPYTVDCDAIMFQKGFGPTELSLPLDSNGRRHLVFAGAPRCDLALGFTLAGTGRLLHSSTVAAGTLRVPLPESVDRRLKGHQKINITLTPVIGPFGKPAPAYASTIELEV